MKPLQRPGIFPELFHLYIGLSGEGCPGEAIAEERVVSLLEERFESFTITKGNGFFRGKPEPVLIVHIASGDPGKIVDAAATIRETLSQEGVGIAFRGRYHRVTATSSPCFS